MESAPAHRPDAAANTPLDALDFTSAPAFLKPLFLTEPCLKWGTW